MANNKMKEFLVWLRGLDTMVNAMSAKPIEMPKEIADYFFYKIDEFMKYEISPNIKLKREEDYASTIIEVDYVDENGSIKTEVFDVKDFINLLENRNNDYDLTDKFKELFKNRGILKDHYTMNNEE